jgi:hypothetical protein
VENLRNEGNIFSLQMILGHNSLDMVRNYLQPAKADTENTHRRASPADKWKLCTLLQSRNILAEDMCHYSSREKPDRMMKQADARIDMAGNKLSRFSL